MDLLEYQAKQLFAQHGVPVPAGEVAGTPAEAAEVATRLGTTVVVKAQVSVGGRGKAGGVKLASDPGEAANRAQEIIGMDIKGHRVGSVLVEEAGDIAAEYYLSYLTDRASRGYLALVSQQGGVEIEEVAATSPEALVRLAVDPQRGVDAAIARELARAAGFPSPAVERAPEVFVALWEVFEVEDATLVEVNPLVLTRDGRLLALDGKVSLDDNARFRHPEWLAYEDPTSVDPLEARARAKHLNYVKLDGSVGVIGNGAGLVMSTLDVVADAGAEFGGVSPANFLDIGGGASAEVMADGLSIVLSDPGVRAVLVNIFGGITQCDAVAEGIVRAVAILGRLEKPLVVRLDGNNAEAGRRILAEAAIDGVRIADTMDGAARLAAGLAAGEL